MTALSAKHVKVGDGRLLLMLHETGKASVTLHVSAGLASASAGSLAVTPAELRELAAAALALAEHAEARPCAVEASTSQPGAEPKAEPSIQEPTP